MKASFMKIQSINCFILLLITKEFKNYQNKYFKTFKRYPSEIAILTYKCIGLIYYTWKKKINNVSDFYFKGKIKGKIGTLVLIIKIIQDLSIYKAENKKFTRF